MIRKCCFIIPYFGKLPNYFQLFLNSCSYNQDFDWLIVTDSKQQFSVPSNVTFKFMSFADMRSLIKEKMGFDSVLDCPYKLCDYKPAYGFLFEELINDYRFWGHCDVDTLMGNLSEFITDAFLEKYDKIFCLGHMVLYRNSYENNRFFMSEYKGYYPYKMVYSNNEIKVFDEDGYNDYNINQMYLAAGKKVLQKDFSMNVSVDSTKFRRTVFTGKKENSYTHGYSVEPLKEAVYLWNHGNIVRYYMNQGRLVEERFLYVHLQSRLMKIEGNLNCCSKIQIVPNRFLDFENKIVTAQNFQKIKKDFFCCHKLQQIYKYKIKPLFRFGK